MIETLNALTLNFLEKEENKFFLEDPPEGFRKEEAIMIIFQQTNIYDPELADLVERLLVYFRHNVSLILIFRNKMSEKEPLTH